MHAMSVFDSVYNPKKYFFLCRSFFFFKNSEACIGVLGIQDNCHFTSKDIGYITIHFTSRDMGYRVQYFR